jgi:thiol-disulfide isomerase/thioredoxin
MEYDMKRRTFLGAALAVAALPMAASATEVLTYVPGLVDERLANGEVVFVDFYADWCSTCRAQHRVIESLKATNPDYAAKITFIQVDWDTYSEEALTTRLEIPRRSTLVVLKGDQELGRIVAATGQGDIEKLMMTALDAVS